MKHHVAVYFMKDLTDAAELEDIVFVRFFLADDRDHAYEQAADALEEGEGLAGVWRVPERGRG